MFVVLIAAPIASSHQPPGAENSCSSQITATAYAGLAAVEESSSP